MILTIDIGEIIDKNPDFFEKFFAHVREEEREHILRKLHGIDDP